MARLKSASSNERLANKIRIGTSGFSYDDWVGPFYPRGLPKSKWFDYYAREFSCLEINASYYTWMSPRALESLTNRAPASFRFAIKLHRSLTHGKDDIAHGIMATGEQNRPLDDPIHLAQFPNGFKANAENWARVEALAALPRLVVEFRNRDWQTDETYKRLRKLDISLCAVDGPNIQGLPKFSKNVTGDIAYTRMHGRNAEKWYEHERAFERYNYLYSEKEIVKISADISEMSEKTQGSYVFFNNHYGAQAVTNARQLAATLGIMSTAKQETLFD
jgi:uncharacterized protein YecE (DUF72 family)